MTLYCCKCCKVAKTEDGWSFQGNTNAVTVFNGYALCEQHLFQAQNKLVEWADL